MGTSKSLSTPSGGDWAALKKEISRLVGSGNGAGTTAPTVVGGTIAAAGGIGGPSVGRGGGGGRAGTLGRSVSGLAGFATTVRGQGLDAALDRLGLGDLRGKPAAEVIARIAEHLASGASGVAGELLTQALRDVLVEIATPTDGVTYAGLEDTLQAFLASEGIEGFVEVFLTQLVEDSVWALIEEHVELKAESEAAVEGLATAVGATCRSEVQSLIDETRASGEFDRIDWFGSQGHALGTAIITTLEGRLAALRDKEGSP